MTLNPAQTRFLAWAALALVAGWVLHLLGPVLMPFVVAAVMAYALHPAVDALYRRRCPRWLGAGVVMVLFMLALAAIVLLIVPVVSKQLPLLREQVPELLEHANAWLVPWVNRLGLEAQIDVDSVRELLSRLLSQHQGNLMESAISSLRIGGSVLLAVLGNLVLMPIVAYYLLLDWAALVRRVRAFVPPRWQAGTDNFFGETDQVLGQYLRGQLLVMGVLAVFYTVALALVGLELALPIGVFTGLAVFVPYLGFGLGLVLGLLAALLQFQSIEGVLLVATVYAVGQVFESLYLTPRLVGERIGLHPIAVIFALMVFGHLLGFVGVLIALPASAVVLVGLRRLRTAYTQSNLYTDGAPPPKP
jgi:predicted PurR-regulated permease PerM